MVAPHGRASSSAPTVRLAKTSPGCSLATTMVVPDLHVPGVIHGCAEMPAHRGRRGRAYFSSAKMAQRKQAVLLDAHQRFGYPPVRTLADMDEAERARLAAQLAEEHACRVTFRNQLP